MGTGYFQLTVTSEHDKYLVGNPQFTYFKGVYRRHTNFAVENRIINFTGDTFMGTNHNFGKKLYTNIPKNGDLLHRMYVVFNIEDVTQKTASSSLDESLQQIRDSISVSGFSLIDYVEIKIGDQTIDKHTGEWMHMYHEIFLKEGKNFALCDMIHTHDNCKGTDKYNNHKDGNIYIPLQFWFNKNPGLSLPLVALQNMDVRIELKLNNRSTIENKIQSVNTLKINKINLLVEYIHLDNQEKIKSELNYIGSKMQEVKNKGGRNDLWLVDSNFGMYNEDIETCKSIAKCQEKYHWPEYIQCDTGKNNKPRVLNAARLVKGAIRLSGSVQTLDEDVLKNIKRSNISGEGLMQLAVEAAEIDADSRSEIILGLPGESLKSHFETINTVINARFNHVNTYQLMMLPGTEIDAPSTRNEFEMKTRYRILPRCFGYYECDWSDCGVG